MVAQVLNPGAWEAEAGQGVQGQPGLPREFQDSQTYEVRHCLKKTTTKLGTLISYCMGCKTWKVMWTKGMEAGNSWNGH